MDILPSEILDMILDYTSLSETLNLIRTNKMLYSRKDFIYSVDDPSTRLKRLILTNPKIIIPSSVKFLAISPENPDKIHDLDISYTKIRELWLKSFRFKTINRSIHVLPQTLRKLVTVNCTVAWIYTDRLRNLSHIVINERKKKVVNYKIGHKTIPKSHRFAKIMDDAKIYRCKKYV